MRTLTRLMILLLAGFCIPACTGQNNTPGVTPTFGGATGAAPGVNPGEVTLSWLPAVDIGGGGVTYLVYDGISGPGSESATPSFSTSNGTGMVCTTLTSGSPYVFIVRAQDITSGNIDGNSIEVGAFAK